MITALSTPAAGRVILDGNTTLIKIQSTNGAGYYFRAKIYVDGHLFDEQGWSREDDFTAVKDLKKLYHAYFDPQFLPVFTNGLATLTRLTHQVQITIEEYNIETGELTDTLELPAFYILYSVKPETFSDEIKIRLMGMHAPVMAVPENGKIAFPFYINAEDEFVTVKYLTNFGTTLHEYATSATGKKVMYLRYDLALLELANNITDITAEVSCGAVKIRQAFRIIRNPDFPVKEIAFRNNFGYYLYAYPDGEMEVSNAFSKESFETLEGQEIDFEVNEEATYTINTGSLLRNEKEVMNMIANSLDSRINIGGEWIAMAGRTKKQLAFKDRQHQYAENLVFSLKKGTNIENTGMVEVAGPLLDIYITGHELVAPSGGFRTAKIFFSLNNGFTVPILHLQFRTSLADPWSNSTGGNTSPRVITLPLGHYYLRFENPFNPLIVSNTIEITL